MSDALLSDDASQASQRSGMTGSLLERIRAQREAQQRAAAARESSAVEVPSYSPLGSDVVQQPTSHRWSLNVAWPTLGHFAHDNEEASEALLSEQHRHEGESYSMGQYLTTFVQDFYNGFRSMHPVLQIVVVIVLLFVAIKLV